MLLVLLHSSYTTFSNTEIQNIFKNNIEVLIIMTYENILFQIYIYSNLHLYQFDIVELYQV